MRVPAAITGEFHRIGTAVREKRMTVEQALKEIAQICVDRHEHFGLMLTPIETVAPSAVAPIMLNVGPSKEKQAAFDAFYTACKSELPHNDDGTHSGTFWHALMCGIDAYLKAAQGLRDVASGSRTDRTAPCVAQSATELLCRREWVELKTCACRDDQCMRVPADSRIDKA